MAKKKWPRGSGNPPNVELEVADFQAGPQAVLG